jgi:hypothetical protein
MALGARQYEVDHIPPFPKGGLRCGPFYLARGHVTFIMLMHLGAASAAPFLFGEPAPTAGQRRPS